MNMINLFKCFCSILEVKSMVPVDTETNMNLKTETEKTDVINQPHNAIKDTIALT